MTTTGKELKTEMFENYYEPLHGDILCNLCGKSCVNIKNINTIPNGLIEQPVYGGEDSEVFQDYHMYRFSLCEFCLHSIFENFMTPPAITDNSKFSIMDIAFDDRIDYIKTLLSKMHMALYYTQNGDGEYYNEIYNKLLDINKTIDDVIYKKKVHTVVR